MSARGRGQAVVEFGILALLFVLILFAIGDFGLLLNGWVAVSSSAREGARRASVGSFVSDTITATRSFAPVPGVDRSALKILVIYGDCAGSCTVYCSLGATPPAGYPVCQPQALNSTNPQAPPAGPSPNTLVSVTVTADTFEVITPLVRPLFGCAGNAAHCYVPITSSTSMRYEGPP